MEKTFSIVSFRFSMPDGTMASMYRGRQKWEQMNHSGCRSPDVAMGYNKCIPAHKPYFHKYLSGKNNAQNPWPQSSYPPYLTSENHHIIISSFLSL
jgi:hypothetical protein